MTYLTQVPCHFTLSRCALPTGHVLRQLQGRLHQAGWILESHALSININVYNQGKLGCWSASKAPECPPVDIKVIVA